LKLKCEERLFEAMMLLSVVRACTNHAPTFVSFVRFEDPWHLILALATMRGLIKLELFPIDPSEVFAQFVGFFVLIILLGD
jgi:hypothetical protein